MMIMIYTIEHPNIFTSPRGEHSERGKPKRRPNPITSLWWTITSAILRTAVIFHLLIAAGAQGQREQFTKKTWKTTPLPSGADLKKDGAPFHTSGGKSRINAKIT